jgi:hypothetical protein
VRAGQEEYLLISRFDDLIGVVPLLLLGEVADIAGMDEKGELRRHRLDLLDRLGERGGRVGVWRQVEADVAVTDLHEGEASLLNFRRGSFTDQAGRSRHTAAQTPNDSGARLLTLLPVTRAGPIIVAVITALVSSPLSAREYRSREVRSDLLRSSFWSARLLRCKSRLRECCASGSVRGDADANPMRLSRGRQVRNGLSAGGRRIRTIGPVIKETAVERGGRAQPRSSHDTTCA